MPRFSALSARPRWAALLAATAAAGALSACAHDGKPSAMAEPPTLTPLDQFPLRTTEAPTELALAAHPGGLSVNQRRTLADFARQWRDGSSGPLVVRAPEGGPTAAIGAAAARAVADALVQSGVPQSAVQLAGYPAQDAGAPVLISFPGVVADIPDCAQRWDNVVSTGANGVKKNFGCAEHANMAAMIADPREIDTPHALDPADAMRRADVLGKYRTGLKTSSERDDQAKGTVSSVVK